jgi:hypothetical protein
MENAEKALEQVVKRVRPERYSESACVLPVLILLTWGRTDCEDEDNFLRHDDRRPSATLLRVVAAISDLLGRRLTTEEEFECYDNLHTIAKVRRGG